MATQKQNKKVNKKPTSPDHHAQEICPKSPSTPISSEEITELRNAASEKFLRLPKFSKGFRFVPTDYELVRHYLFNKLAGRSLPCDIINDVDVYKYNPQDLTEIYRSFGENEWYFFTPRSRRYEKGNRPNRTAGDGFWRAVGSDKTIKEHGRQIASKKTLDFFWGTPKNSTKTNWIMHEFLPTNAIHSNLQDGTMKLDTWVLCSIRNKRKRLYKLKGEQAAVTCCINEASSSSLQQPGNSRQEEEFMNDQTAIVPHYSPSSGYMLIPQKQQGYFQQEQIFMNDQSAIASQYNSWSSTSYLQQLQGDFHQEEVCINNQTATAPRYTCNTVPKMNALEGEGCRYDQVLADISFEDYTVDSCFFIDASQYQNLDGSSKCNHMHAQEQVTITQ